MMGRDGAWSLAPAYDLSFSTGPGGEHTLTVAGEGRRPGRPHIEEVAARSGVKPARAQEIIAEIDHAVQSWRSEADPLRVPSTLLRTIDEAMATARTW